MKPIRIISISLLLAISIATAPAATVEVISETNRPSIAGKEVDWIDGDFVFKNDQIIGVIAHPTPTRDANMTVRGVGAGIIDLTRQDLQSDQLSAFYPAGGRYSFTDGKSVEHGVRKNGAAHWRCDSTSPLTGDNSVCTVEYELMDGDAFITCTVRIEADDVSKIVPFDSVRADRTFKFDTLKETNIAFCEDENFAQTYGFQNVNGSKAPIWDNGRSKRLTYKDGATISDDKKTIEWKTRIYPASCSIDLAGLSGRAKPITFVVQGAVGEHPRTHVRIVEHDVTWLKEKEYSWRVDDDGKSIVHLPAGTYKLLCDAVGHEQVPVEFHVDDARPQRVVNLPMVRKIVIGFQRASSVAAKITDNDDAAIPCKVSFYGNTGTKDPVFGIDSQDGAVGNTVYSADGQFVQSIPPGDYEAVISYGPEHDAVFEKISVQAGKQTELTAKLKRVVDTTGWVSAELHSHSSPSGDNTSSQLGRVENLLCEHLEFAPCTEHQRVESYDDQLEILKASHRMATCTGMELTGGLLPINHQNAFPMKWKPFAQDGGGPRISGDPVKQIARLAMWDDNSDKVVQTNHPNMRQLLHDKDLNGEDDGGYSKMLDFMDIIEVHPPQDIFIDPATIEDVKKRDQHRIWAWMDLIKSGRRIPGVVNTDAHYNWHGSGWLRNWIASSTDDPAQITVTEMTKNLESGRIMMSTGPFMTVQLNHDDLDKPASVGDTVAISSGDATLAVKVQCANWLDVNRVEVFINGKMQPELSRTRSTHPEAFGNDVIKFDQQLPVKLDGDTFVIVAAIGEKMTLGKVMGAQYGKFPPVVVSNPIFVKAR